jgi:hypothetical protein
MKKIYFNLFAVLFLSQISNAQLSLSQTNYEPIVGDTNKAYLVDTGLVNIKTINAVTGSNALWDFSSLSVLGNSITSTIYTSTASASSATNFPGSTFVQSNSNFFKSVVTPSAQTELLGSALIGASLNFTNSAIVSKYPFTYPNNYTDSYSGTVTYTSNGTFSGSITVNADGTGTLNLPGGQVFTNVLRVKSTQNTVANNVIPFIPVTVRVTNYDYYHASQKYPIFNVNYNSIAILTPTITATIRANVKSTIVGINENTLLNQNLVMYPNPAKDYFNFNLINTTNEIVNVTIYNTLGQLVKTINLGNEAVIQKAIVISDLKSGIYIVKTSLGNAVSARRLVIE